MRGPERRPPVADRPRESHAVVLRSATRGETTRGAVHQRSHRLGFDTVGLHDRLDQRIRQKVIKGKTGAWQHDASFEFGDQAFASGFWLTSGNRDVTDR